MSSRLLIVRHVRGQSWSYPYSMLFARGSSACYGSREWIGVRLVLTGLGR